eukprot:11154667-Lingulodinium_polyedra.AAC.1
MAAQARARARAQVQPEGQAGAGPCSPMAGARRRPRWHLCCGVARPAGSSGPSEVSRVRSRAWGQRDQVERLGRRAVAW